MNAIDLGSLFSYVCGQGRCFVIHGSVLPVCQRCLGLYAAVVVSGTALLFSGTWRRGYPSRNKVVLHALMLLTAMLGGLHAIDGGPAWRLICGLWTGHVAVVWVSGGVAVLAGRTRSMNTPRWCTLAGGLAPALYALAAWAFVLGCC